MGKRIGTPGPFFFFSTNVPNQQFQALIEAFPKFLTSYTRPRSMWHVCQQTKTGEGGGGRMSETGTCQYLHKKNTYVNPWTAFPNLLVYENESGVRRVVDLWTLALRAHLPFARLWNFLRAQADVVKIEQEVLFTQRRHELLLTQPHVKEGGAPRT